VKELQTSITHLTCANALELGRSAYLESMTRADDGGRLLRFLVADGPLPSSAGRQAWVQNGWPADDERLLTAALRKAGIKPEHHGHPGVAQRWWWKAPGDTRPTGAEIRTHECTACRKLLELPSGHRYCISTANCPGHYEPTPQFTLATQTTPGSHRVSSISFNSEEWRTRPSPMRSMPVTRRNARSRLARWS
jgi:hypothetical protein